MPLEYNILQHRYKLTSIDKSNIIKTNTYDNIWVQMIGNDKKNLPCGFDKSSNFATRGIAIYKGELYIGTQNTNLSGKRLLKLLNNPMDIYTYYLWRLLLRAPILDNLLIDVIRILNNNDLPEFFNRVLNLLASMSDGGELWKYNYTTNKWAPIVSNLPGAKKQAGFGNHKVFAISILYPFKGKLYVGTSASSDMGCEIWRYDGKNFEKVVDKGFGDLNNSGAWSVIEYRGKLYVGTMNWKEGCQIWRTDDGINWEKVKLPGGDGFGCKWNVYAWSFGIYRGRLYLGTFNLKPGGGCQLWRFDGINWKKIDLPGGDGFGESENYGIRNIVEYRDELYIGCATNVFQEKEGCEIWKYDGKKWYPVIGEKAEIGDGFGDIYNKYVWSMTVSSDNKLWVGTLNVKSIHSIILTKGCEIWCYDGNNWNRRVGKNGREMPNGFGNRYNMGARSMIEYPRGSGNLWVGTFTSALTKNGQKVGCEIWMRQNTK